MSIGDPFQITYNAVTKDLVKVNQDNYGSEYYLDDGTNRFTLSVKHTIPSRGSAGESHLFRLDVEEDDADGNLFRVASAWLVIRTDKTMQDVNSSQYVSEAIVDALTDANLTKLIGRES
jgi:hypothetical protein